MSKIGKEEIVDALMRQGCERLQAKVIYVTIKNRLRQAVQDGDEINLFDLAKITVVDRPARVGRNPQTGEPVQVPAKKALKIKLRQAGKDALGR